MLSGKQFFIRAIYFLLFLVIIGNIASYAADTREVVQSSAAGMTIEQTLSDEGQRNTISFSALAFLTGSLGADSFFPPGKVADFWGFQYLRDNDPSEKGHNTDFLTKAANNMLFVLNENQIAQLIELAENQVQSINQYAYQRFALMKAFRRQLEADLPSASTGLDEVAVKAYSAQLYRLDGEISLQRAEVMGDILHNLDNEQGAYLDVLKGKGMLDWPDVEEQLDRRDYEHDVHVAIMTYAGDLFSWYLGSLEADVYFAPERQGTYFGSFYMKDAPAMGNADYTIDSALTGNMGQTLLDMLTTEQALILTEIVDIQRDALNKIVDVRQAISTQLRGLIEGKTVDSDVILGLMEEYGELDGEIIYLYATHFAQLSNFLSSEQQAEMADLRLQILGDFVPDGAYLYSDPIEMPTIRNTDFLFGVGSATDSESCPENNVESVDYDLSKGVLILNRVKAGELWYFVELHNIGDLVFEIIEAHTISVDGTQQTFACYNFNTLILSIPQVKIETNIYSVTLDHKGDWLFRIQNVTP